jgi:hypothetical protein
MKTLLAVGCSFTNPNYRSREHPEMDCSWPKWPEIVGKRLGYNVVNLGKNGASNDNIMRSAQDYMTTQKVDMVCALWTEPCRLNIHDAYHGNWYAYLKQDAESIAGAKYRHAKQATKSLVDYNAIAQNLCRTDDHLLLASEMLRNMHTLDIIGKSYNVPVYHMQGVVLWKTHVYKTANKISGDYMTESEINKKFKSWLNAFIQSPYFDILDKQTNIWGWPFYEELGGELPFDAKMDNLAFDTNRISFNDTHPSAKGQQTLADKYLELIEQNATN